MHPPFRSAFAWLSGVFVFVSSLSAQTPPSPPLAADTLSGAFAHALKLEKQGSFIELPAGVFNDMTEGTVEAWVKLNGLQAHMQRIITYNTSGRGFALTTQRGTNSVWFLIFGPATDGYKSAIAKDALKVGEWMHVAAVAGKGGMRLYYECRKLVDRNVA